MVRRIDARPVAWAAFYSMRRYRNRQAELTCVQRGTIPGAGREEVTAYAVAAGAVERILSGCCSVCVPTPLVRPCGPVKVVWLDKHGNTWQGIQ